MITTDEVAAVLGGTVTNAPSGPYDCEFKSSSNKAILVSAAVSRQGFDTASQAFQGTAVSGIGDAAYIAPSKNIVSFIKGQNVISIKAGFSLASPDAANQIEDLAKKAAARA